MTQPISGIIKTKWTPEVEGKLREFVDVLVGLRIGLKDAVESVKDEMIRNAVGRMRKAEGGKDNWEKVAYWLDIDRRTVFRWRTGRR